MRGPTRILLVDDNLPLRAAMRALFRTEPTFVVAGEAGDGATAVRLAAELAPDVVVMDVHMPGAFDGIEATRRILAAAPLDPAARPVVIGLSASDEHAQGMLDAGATAFLSKAGAEGAIDLIKDVLDRARV